MPKRASNEKVSPDTDMKKLEQTDSTFGGSPVGGSPVDTECAPQFPVTECAPQFPVTGRQDASHGAMVNDTSLDTENKDTPVTSDPLYEVFTVITAKLAKLDRERQGPLEAEYTYGGEADLHRHYDNCTKNPGHDNFIPADKFRIEDLPERYRNSDMVDYIRAVSDLTVRVTVKYVSESRPKTIFVRGKRYQGYHYKGQRRTTVGTGWVKEVAIRHDEIDQTCNCKDCRKSSTPETKFARISIITTTHVVYDESEAEHTTCHLYFDKKGTLETCKDVVALAGMVCRSSNRDSDYCEMHHDTHDLEVAEKLKKRCQEREKLRREIGAKLQETTNFKCSTLDEQPLLFIVSHPHGCSKQISIGRWTSAREQPNGSHSYTYTTATCPGSSGAPVCLPQTNTSISTLPFHSIYPIHAGVFDEQPGMNFSIASSDMDTVDAPDTPVTSDTLALSRLDREGQDMDTVNIMDTADTLILARLNRAYPDWKEIWSKCRYEFKDM